MKLRRLSEPGVNSFERYLAQLRVEPGTPTPEELLTDAASSEPAYEVEIERREFGSRYDAAKYLDEVFTNASARNLERDRGLWTWLTLFFFDQVCPTGDSGSRKILEKWRYLPAIGDYQKFFRHLLMGPYLIYHGHDRDLKRVSAILANRLYITDDLMEQIAGYQDLIRNPSVLAVQTSLYFDFERNELKTGARGSGNGSPRRLAAVLNQYDLTYDLFGVDSSPLLKLLPKEFSRFIANPSPATAGAAPVSRRRKQ